MRILTAGNVGIGTTSPAEKLEVRDGRILINHNDNGSALLDANVATLDIVNRSGTAGAGPKINFHGWGYGTYSNQIGAAIAAPLISASTSGATQDLVFLTRNTDADAELSERMRILKGGNVGIGTTSPGTLLHGLLTSAATNAVTNVVTIGHDTSGTAANGFGAGQLFQLESSTTAAQAAARIQALWYEATHATRKADLVLTAYDTSEREGLRIRGAGSAPAIGFLGATPIVRKAHVADPSGGATVDAEARSAINSILATLEGFGFHATS